MISLRTKRRSGQPREVGPTRDAMCKAVRLLVPGPNQSSKVFSQLNIAAETWGYKGGGPANVPSGRNDGKEGRAQTLKQVSASRSNGFKLGGACHLHSDCTPMFTSNSSRND
jgi:hypothetical protein